MKDPHIEALYYRFISENPNDNFDKAAPLRLSLGSFGIELEDKILKVSPQQHFADEESAKAAFEPFLHSWESVASLDISRSRIRFVYSHADVIDRNPSVADASEIKTKVSELILATDRATITRDMLEFPHPDPSFLASDLTDELLYRLRRFQDGREPLPSTAYYVLERLENKLVGQVQGARKRLARVLNIDYNVLHLLGDLSNRADPRLGRHAEGNRTPLTSVELQWMGEVVVSLIRRAGEINAGVSSLTPITMSDFPDLNP